MILADICRRRKPEDLDAVSRDLTRLACRARRLCGSTAWRVWRLREIWSIRDRDCWSASGQGLPFC